MKNVLYKYVSAKAQLKITADSAEAAEKIMLDLVKDRDKWNLVGVNDTDIMKSLIGGD